MERPMTPSEMESMARERRLSIAQICREANVNQSTFQRWKQGSSPTIGTYCDLLDAIDRLTEQNSIKQEI